MDKYSLHDAIGEMADDFLIDAEQVIKNAGKHKASRHKIKGAVAAIAAVIAVLGATTAVAANRGYNILEWISEAFTSNGTEYSPSVLQAELDEGQWAYLNGDNIAVMIPESPVKIMLSDDAGKTWKESTVVGSESWDFLGEWRTNMQYWGGYIGFNDAETGYLVLTSGVAMNHQGLRIYLTSDGGKTWSEIGNPYDQHISVLTGAGFSSEGIGFISYRYYYDAGPDIWWTKDRGETWSKLEISIPAEYQDGYNFTPQTPTFSGKEGVYPILASEADGEGETMIYMYSHDGGLSWSFE